MKKISTLLKNGLSRVVGNTNLLFALFLIVVLPLLLLFSGRQFLQVGKDNQDLLERERIGLVQDVFVSLVETTSADKLILQSEIENITDINPDIVAFKIVQKIDAGYVTLVSDHRDEIGSLEEETYLYDLAFSRPDESLVETVVIGGERLMRAVRLADVRGGDFVILTVTSRAAIDQKFKNNEQLAYFTLLFIFLFLVGLAFWISRLTNYQMLYKNLQKTLKEKDLFTNMIAHELRAPLTAIRGYASMAQEDLQSDEMEKYISRIDISSERLLNIINDLLDVARIQSGKLSVDISNCSISEVVRVVSEELQVTAANKKIVLILALEAEDIFAFADKKRLHQAVTNLVSNSIKYTKEGAITLRVSQKKEWVEIRVEDTGMGISAEDQKKLFAPFFRVKSDSVAAITGTGLGMWITKQMIELMGGKIGVESIEGVGTHIVVSLPKKSW